MTVKYFISLLLGNVILNEVKDIDRNLAANRKHFFASLVEMTIATIQFNGIFSIARATPSR